MPNPTGKFYEVLFMNLLRRSSFRANSLFRSLPIAVVIFALTLVALPSQAQTSSSEKEAKESAPRVSLPLSICWYNGRKVYYISTEASDAGVAKALGGSYVPALANTINAPGGAVDDIYVVTNFTQGNIIPSVPMPFGSKNANTAYTPLWQISTVTWNAGITPLLLTSEAQVREAVANSLVTVSKTNIIVNCPIVALQGGGRLPGVKLMLKGDK